MADISPKLRLSNAENELTSPPGTIQMGQNIGGIGSYSTAFKRGYGAQTFGVDNNGIWLGSADYVDAPWTVDMNGNNTIKNGKITIQNENSASILDSKGLISANNFNVDQAGTIDGTTTSTTSTTLVDIPDLILTSFNIQRTTGILILLTATAYATTFIGRLYVHIGGDVNDIQEVHITVPTSSPVYASQTTHNLRYLPSSNPPTSYSIRVKWQTASSGGLVSLARRQISYMLYGT